MVLIIWDRFFGTFAKEEEKVVYGLTKNIHSYNPIKMVFHEWMAIINDVKKVKGFKNKLGYIFNPPGWSHDGSSKTANELRAELKAKS